MKFLEFIPLDVDSLSAQQIALVRSGFSHKNPPPIWVEMAKLGYMILRNAPAFKVISDQDLVKVCVAQVYQLTRVMGGRNVYLSKGDSVGLTEKNKRIAAEFNGRNYDELGKKHGLSSARIRQIVGQQAALKKAASHPEEMPC